MSKVKINSPTLCDVHKGLIPASAIKEKQKYNSLTKIQSSIFNPQTKKVGILLPLGDSFLDFSCDRLWWFLSRKIHNITLLGIIVNDRLSLPVEGFQP